MKLDLENQQLSTNNYQPTANNHFFFPFGGHLSRPFASGLSGLIGIALISLICFSACDYIKDPIENTTINNTNIDSAATHTTIDSTGSSVRNILLEEFTGQKCPNCPAGATEAEQLKTTYGKQLILVEIHAGFFADPDASGDFTTDYTTPAGNDYNSTFNVLSYPAGMISRLKIAGVYPMTKDNWDAAIQTIKNDTPIVKMKLMNVYDSTSRQLTSKITAGWLQNGTSTYKLVVYILENHLVSPQQNGSIVEPSYDHMHVLRKAVNGTWGEQLDSTNMGNTNTKSYSFTLPSNWKDADCSVIAYIYDANTTSATHYEIFQAVEADVK